MPAVRQLSRVCCHLRGLFLFSSVPHKGGHCANIHPNVYFVENFLPLAGRRVFEPEEDPAFAVLVLLKIPFCVGGVGPPHPGEVFFLGSR